jgi:hypothetical protein
MGCFNTHASGTLDPPEVRNWRIHLIALVASMSALASKFTSWDIQPCSPSLFRAYFPNTPAAL